MEKTKAKKRTQDGLITSVIVVAAIIAFMGGYVLSGDLNRSYFNITNNKTEKSEMSGLEIAGASIGGAGLSEGTTLGFNENYVISEGDYDYKYELGTYAGTGDSYITLEYGNTKSEINFVKYYYENDNSEVYPISFDKNVVDVHMSTFDMNPDYNTVLLLLDDGSVEYVFIEKALETNDFNSLGKIEGISNIAKFYEGTFCETDTPICTKTTFAQDMNGKIYNLYEYVVE